MLQILDDGQALDKSHLQAASQLHGEIHDVIVTSCRERPHTVAEQIKEDRVARSYLPEGIFSEDFLRGSEVHTLQLCQTSKRGEYCCLELLRLLLLKAKTLPKLEIKKKTRKKCYNQSASLLITPMISRFC